MRVACIAVMLMACVQLSAQTLPTFDLHGNLDHVDLPSEATPVEAILVSLHPKKEGVFDIQAQPDRSGNFVTLRLSCYLNALTAPKTTFRYVPPGRYRIFIVDSQLQSKVAAYAPRFPDFLKNQATTVEVLEKGKTKATAPYVDGKAVQQAIQQAGPIP